MSRPDFEIQAGLKARRLRARVPPSGDLQADEPVEIDQRRSGTSRAEEIEAGKTYSDVVIQRKVVGRLRA